MRAHALLNLLNELGKRDKMGGLPSILSHFFKEYNKFNKFNNTEARMFDSIFYMTLRLLTFCRKNILTLSLCTQRFMDVITFPENL